MSITRNGSIMVQGASASGILSGTYGGTGANLTPTTAGNVIFTADGSVWSSTQKIVRGTSVSASGTSVDFTSIPSWAKRITIMVSGVSMTATGLYLFQIGTGGVPTTSGYSAVYTTAFGTNSVNTGTSTAGFPAGGGVATYAFSGNIFLTNLTGNTWACSGLVSNTTTTPYTAQIAGAVTLAGTLNFVRMTTTAGTDTFDAGSINILYE